MLLLQADDSGIVDCDVSDSGLEDGSVMENSSGEGDSDDGEGSEIAECTERVDKQDEVEAKETGDEEVKHEDDGTDIAANKETETMNDLQVRINLDAEQFSNSYITISVGVITIKIHISGKCSG